MQKGKKTASSSSGGRGTSGGVSNSVKTRLFGQADAPKTAQQTIPFKEMHRDGVCRVTNKLYTKTYCSET
jgi:hypothetical protein